MATYLNGKAFFTGDFNATGYITGLRVGASGYLTAQTNTTITEAGTFQPILGAFTVTTAQKFSDASAGGTTILQYDGTKTQFFEIDWHCLASANLNTTATSITVAKNGSPLSGYITGSFMKNADQEYSSGGTSILELAKGDTIQFVVTTDGAGDVVTFDKIVASITEFFD
jgi:hypothetical protein